MRASAVCLLVSLLSPVSLKKSSVFLINFLKKNKKKIDKKCVLSYNTNMKKIKRSDIFDKWLSKLKDATGKAKIIDRIQLLKRGSKGDHRIIDKDIYELRIHFGPGYRVYCTNRNDEVILLLIAGNKSTQSRDIKKAKEMIELLDKEEAIEKKN